MVQGSHKDSKHVYDQEEGFALFMNPQPVQT